MNKLWVALFLVLITGVLSGCGSLGPESSVFGDNRVTTASANQMLDPDFEGFTDEQLIQLLDPLNQGGASEVSNAQNSNNLSRAFRNANNDPQYGIAHRSQIQDRLIAASNQRCNVYTTYLKRISTYQNSIFGTLTTILGGAGAIVTGENAARLLSGLAGISSGTRAELNQATFEATATSVIIPGIQKSRSELMKEMLNKRSKPLQEYTIEGAVGDAIAYHGACSMDTGISYAQKSIQSYDDLGIKKFNEIQNQLGIARNASESFTIGPLATLVVAEKVLDDFAKKLPDYKGKTNPAKAEQKPFINNIDQFIASAKDGSLRSEAAKLDDDLKTAIFNFASTTGAEKSSNASMLNAQQIQAKDFAKKLDAMQAQILIELKKISP